MSKVYVVFHDNLNRILVGRGGSANGAPRQGYHLPGGTVGLPYQDLTRMEIQAGAVREVEEEFGTARMVRVYERLADVNVQIERIWYGPPLGSDYVNTIAVHLSVAEMDSMVGPVNDGHGNALDTPFDACDQITYAEAQIEFSLPTKNYFLDGVELYLGAAFAYDDDD